MVPLFFGKNTQNYREDQDYPGDNCAVVKQFFSSPFAAVEIGFAPETGTQA
jgi:hypothetical protein